MAVIGWQPRKHNTAWSSFYGYRGFRTSQFYGEAPKPNKTYLCAEESDNCTQCNTCCEAQYPTNASKAKACKRRCRRKYSASACTGGAVTGGCPSGCPQGYVCKDGHCDPLPPPGAEQCPVVCVPDGTGVTCNYNCMGVTRNIINTGNPGEVIPVSKVVSWYKPSSSSWFNSSLFSSNASTDWNTASSWGSSIPSIEDEGGGMPNLTTMLLVGGGGYLLYKFLKK